MDYYETKIKETIREACYLAMENLVNLSVTKKDDDPYSAVELREVLKQDMSVHVNKIVESCYNRLQQYKEKK